MESSSLTHLFQISCWRARFHRGIVAPHTSAHGYHRITSVLITGSTELGQMTFAGRISWTGNRDQPPPESWCPRTQYAAWARSAIIKLAEARWQAGYGLCGQAVDHLYSASDEDLPGFTGSKKR